MKKHLATFIALALLASGAYAQATISITPPTITSWTQDFSGITYTATQPELDTLNSKLDLAINGSGGIVEKLNTTVLNNMKTFPELNRGFANANTAAFDNASLLGYQNYDLFAVAVGGNLGVAVPTLDPAGGQKALNEIVDKGDVYVGLGTGGFAVQAGLNLGLIIPNLYVTGKFGFIPEMPLADASYSQGMFGVGANYSVIKGFDLLFGLVKWRGLNLGSGLVFNGNKVSVSVPIASRSEPVSMTMNGQTVNLTAKTTNTKAKFTVESSSVVIPIDLATSLQALWFLNVGLGVGADLAFSSGSVKLGGSSDVVLEGGKNYTATPGSVELKANQASKGGDFFNPRIMGSLGLGLAVFKLDVPVSYYPLTKAFSFGLTGAVVW